MLAQSFDLTEREFDLFREIIHRETGIALSEKKKRLLVARLSKRLRALNLESFSAYHDYLQNHPDSEKELSNLINRITTNKTDFFREKHHFDFMLNEMFPALIKQRESSGDKKIRIWSAGCSSGEEPYTIAMTVKEAFSGQHGWDIKILATDLDTEILARAKNGTYDSATVEPVPPAYLTKYFNRTASGYEVIPQVKNMIAFRKLNLMAPQFPMKGLFDVIFCRNVIIYFDAPTKETLMNKFHSYLKPDGYIFIGHSESLMNMKVKFSYMKNTIYRKS